ncbi:MAG: hypothetical protein ACMUIE_09535, partial [Thermoplasmatota archaeon]
ITEYYYDLNEIKDPYAVAPEEEEGGGPNWFLILLIILLVAAAAFALMKRKQIRSKLGKRAKPEQAEVKEPAPVSADEPELTSGPLEPEVVPDAPPDESG